MASRTGLFLWRLIHSHLLQLRSTSCNSLESSFSLLQKNVLNGRSWATQEELSFAIVTWIERTYRRRRRQVRLGRLTPIEFEAIMNTAAAPTLTSKHDASNGSTTSANQDPSKPFDTDRSIHSPGHHPEMRATSLHRGQL